ncbi:alpha/beta hydrolase [Mycolicibacterium agri]|uniref:Alpha/beta hydrolase n=1 Tax=Mycolicibacterium agri TaxID=36811 RepID=A0A2A7MQF3_MYCAG|nr:alpha/beta hydrolase [Mycolicibacterium agri]PEG33733.1 alpha/beta hydrolase [Mycolicibacterium agri]GFG55817.1 alpha/beta hydrolase [Mycolicibacterium agri]
MSSPTPIVLIHGLWLSAASWAPWVERYRDAGLCVHAPAWPEGPDIGLAEATDHFEAFVRSLPDPPILIGHSMGGLITQLLLGRGVGTAGVAIQPSKPRGVLRAPLSMLRSVAFVLRDPRNRHREVPITPGHFHYAFANTLSRSESDELHARLTIPAPGRAVFDVAFADLVPKSTAPSTVDFTKSDRAPLLLIAGDRDHLMPASVVYENYNRYRRSRAATDFKVFQNRPHLITAVRGWEDVADYALTWTLRHTG